MNQYVTLYLQGGTDLIRSIQQQLNRKYEDYIGLAPCDGLYGREMNKALILVLQAIEGLSVDKATGNFGDTTKEKCPILPDTSGTLSDSVIEKATFLLKYALCCNGYTVSVSSADWSETLVSTIKEFQRDLKLTVTGTANIDTWMSLLLSKGNPDRSCVACDTRFEITSSRAAELKNKGYEIVGRYLTGTTFKVLRDDEPQRILDSGLYFFPIFQESSTSVSYFVKERGKANAENAVRAARKFRIPEGNVIYFAVDLDATSAQITTYILPYFSSLHNNMDINYKIGIYGTRNVCTQVCNAGYAETCFVSDILEQLYVDWYTPLFEAAPSTVPYLSSSVLAAGITNFLRSLAYNDLLWDLAMFKAIDEGFVNYVKQENMNLYNYFYDYIKEENSLLISDGIGGLIDLKHLAATTECYFSATPAPDFWAGWGGDLATAMSDTDAYVAANGTSHQEAADVIVGHANQYSFSYAGLCSDADAIKLADIISASTSNTNAFSESLRDYYQNYMQNRFSYFLGDIKCASNLTALKEGIYENMTSFLENIGLIKFLGGEPSTEAISACCNAFANYIYAEI